MTYPTICLMEYGNVHAWNPLRPLDVGIHCGMKRPCSTTALVQTRTCDRCGKQQHRYQNKPGKWCPSWHEEVKV